METLRRYWRRILALIGVSTGLDIIKEFVRGKAENWVATHLGWFGYWLVANPFALLTVSVIACLFWLALAALKECQTHSVIVDQNHKQFAHPRTARRWNALMAIATVVVAGLVSYGAGKYYYVVTHAVAHPPAPNPPTNFNAGILLAEPMFLQEGKVFTLSKSVIPCARERIAYGTTGLNAVPGPGSGRPWLVIDPIGYRFLDWSGEKHVHLLFQVEVTNRGEPSIVKDWELCLVSPDQSVARVPCR